MPFGLVLRMTLTMLVLFGFLFGLLAVASIYFDFSIYVSVGLAVLIVLAQWVIGPSIIRWTTNMRDLKKGEYPWVGEFVADLCKKHKLKMPKLAVVNTGEPNAFVFGRTSSSATLCLTQGLLKSLNREEVKGVISHEVGHIKHNDMVVMTIVSSVPIIAFFVARSLLFAPRGGDRRDAGYLILVGLGAWIVYFLTNMLVLLMSRSREYYADRFGGENYKPATLASALAKITYGLSLSKDQFNSAAKYFLVADADTSKYEVANFSQEFSDLHISKEEVKKAMEWERKNPYARISELFRSHPLTFKRIKVLHDLEAGMGEEN